jgi:hypothetical protein
VFTLEKKLIDKMGKTRKTGKTGAAADYGSDRKHLTSREVEKLIDASKDDRNEVLDRCLVDTESRVLHVTRLKQGLSTTQPPRAFPLVSLDYTV